MKLRNNYSIYRSDWDWCDGCQCMRKTLYIMVTNDDGTVEQTGCLLCLVRAERYQQEEDNRRMSEDEFSDMSHIREEEGMVHAGYSG